MKQVYLFDYINENEFKKLERAVKKYNMLAYKKLCFEYYPSLKEGNLLGEKVKENNETDSEYYELKLPTDIMFCRVHGVMTLHYILYRKTNTIMLDKFTPTDILSEGHQSELVAYKGVMVSKDHADKDMFKINLLNMLNK